MTTYVPYPTTLSADPPDRVANWRPLVHWFLAIPHWIVLAALGTASQALAFISWCMVVFTGRLPAGIANFQAMYLRYSARVISYGAFLREDYPPFEFTMTAADPGDDQRVRVDVVPQLEGRNRMTGAFRLILAIPHLIAMALLGLVLYLVVFVAGVAVLFTGRWPAGLRDFVIGCGRWFLRANAYLLLLTDDYPPFTTA